MRKLIALSAGLVLASSVSYAQGTPMRCSHQLPPKHHIAQVIDKWAAEVESQSSGGIDVQVFGANSLRNAKQNIASVAKDDIECAEAAAFLDAKLMEKGVHNVVWLFTTRMSAYTSKGGPLIKPGDFKGIKIRGINSLVAAGLIALGAAPSAMSGSKVYQALSTGVIDAGLTDISAAYSRKYYEVQDHVTVSPLFSVFFHGYLNPAWYDKLSDANKKALKAASDKAAKWAIDSTEVSAAKAPSQLREKGMKVHVHTAGEIATMKGVMGPAFDKAFSDAAGEDGQKLLDMISKM
jgi:C4-dicarboxylate-binding protein DctP